MKFSIPFLVFYFIFLSSNLSANSHPQFIHHNYIELSKIQKISRFRSQIGHPHHDEFQPCGSMKHYFFPFSNDDYFWKSIKIFSPVDGVVSELYSEHIEIIPNNYPQYTIYIWHAVDLPKHIKIGSRLSSGDSLGHHVGVHTYSDIAVEMNIDSRRKRLSQFHFMNDSVLSEFKDRGINNLDELIISYRDCQQGTAENWVILR